MAQRTGKDVTFTYNGQSFQVLTAGSFNRQKTVEDTTYFGVADQVQASAALRKLADQPVEIIYDDGGTVDGVMQAAYLSDSLFTLIEAWGGTKTSTVQAGLKTYERLPKIGALTRERVTFYFSGAVTEV